MIRVAVGIESKTVDAHEKRLLISVLRLMYSLHHICLKLYFQLYRCLQTSLGVDHHLPCEFYANNRDICEVQANNYSIAVPKFENHAWILIGLLRNVLILQRSNHAHLLRSIVLPMLNRTTIVFGAATKKKYLHKYRLFSCAFQVVQIAYQFGLNTYNFRKLNIIICVQNNTTLKSTEPLTRHNKSLAIQAFPVA